MPTERKRSSGNSKKTVEETPTSKRAKRNQERGQADIEQEKKHPVDKESMVTAAQDNVAEDQSNQAVLEVREKGSEETKKANKKKTKKKKAKAKTAATTDQVAGANEKEEEPQPAKSPVDESDSNDDYEDDDDDDDDDAELLAAAAAWADQNEDETQVDETPNTTTTTTTTPTFTSLTPPNDFSLHITQLPYDTNELDLRRLFAEHGCAITSIRLVYDRDDKGRKTVFRGVAFVDLLNQTSYDKALALNRKSTIRGRKLNVRPTRSKQELATIVTRTREVVQEKIRLQKNQDQSNTDPNTGSNSSTKKVDKKTKQKDKKKEKKEKAKATKKSQPSSKHVSGAKDAKTKGKGKEKQGKGDTTKEEHKMTKKERNRRAAIIHGLNKGKKKG